MTITNIVQQAQSAVDAIQKDAKNTANNLAAISDGLSAATMSYEDGMKEVAELRKKADALEQSVSAQYRRDILEGQLLLKALAQVKASGETVERIQDLTTQAADKADPPPQRTIRAVAKG